MTVTYDQIAQRAFEIWEREGQPGGKDLENWLRAEAELHQRSIRGQQEGKITSQDPALMRPSKGRKN